MFLLPLLLQTAQAEWRFTPPLDRPIRVVTDRSDGEGAEKRGYRIDREVRFSRDGDGFRAEVRLTDVASSGPPGPGALVEAAYATLAGRTIVFRLDGAGKVLDIEDLDAIWAAYVEGMGKIAADTRATGTPEQRKALSDRITAPLLALPRARRFATFASLVEMLAAAAPDPVGSVRPVDVPAASPIGGTATLKGTRTTTALGNLWRSITRAAATIEIPAEGTAAARTGTVELEVIRDVDPATGMLVAGIETNRTALGTGADARRTLKVTMTRVSIL